MSRWSRRLFAVLLPCLLFTGAPMRASALVPFVETGPPALGSALSGVHERGDFRLYSQFGTWRGSRVGLVVEFMGSSTWSSIENSQTWLAGKHQGVTAHFVLSMPMVPTGDDTATVQKCAARYYDSHYVTTARNLVAAGYGRSTIRLGWEMTGFWFKWSKGDSRYYYQSCWRNIVRAFRTVPGQAFTWDFNISDQHVDPRPWYPGDAYVDYIGGDFYDLATGDALWNHTGSWTDLTRGPYALDWVAQWATSHVKPLALTEWGLVWKCPTHASYTWSGGDDTYYVQQIRNWISAHRWQLAWESYFDDEDDPLCHSDVLYRAGHFPNASSLYQRLW